MILQQFFRRLTNKNSLLFKNECNTQLSFNFATSNNYRIDKFDNGMYILHPKEKHTKTLIWLHGLGDTAEGFLDLFLSPMSPVPIDTKIVLPTAPRRPVTINQGAMCHSWYDIRNLNRVGQKDEDLYSLDEAYQSFYTINEILSEELDQVESNKHLYLGGFSQGCALALHTALNSPIAVRGVFGLSGYFLQFSEIKNSAFVKVRLAHGKHDQVIPIKHANLSYERLQEQIFDYKFQAFDNLEHNINQEVLQYFQKEFNEISNFIDIKRKNK